MVRPAPPPRGGGRASEQGQRDRHDGSPPDRGPGHGAVARPANPAPGAGRGGRRSTGGSPAAGRAAPGPRAGPGAAGAPPPAPAPGHGAAAAGAVAAALSTPLVAVLAGVLAAL